MLNTFTSTLKGLTPPSGGGTTNFLRADGTWAAPPTGGGSGPTHAEGTYTATATPVNQISSPAVGQAHYMRIGNRVMVNGAITVVWSHHPSTARVDLSLPIPSDFTTGNDCIGTAVKLQNTTPYAGGYIQADATNNRATLNISEPEGAIVSQTITLYYQYQYVVK
jgi:hypothetical protein